MIILCTHHKGGVGKTELAIHIAGVLRDSTNRILLGSIRDRLNSLATLPEDCEIAPKVRNLQKETGQARRDRRYIWEYPGCEDLAEYYRALLKS